MSTFSHSQIHPGHDHNHHGHPSKRQTCPSGKAYYVCAIGPFKGCCSTDPCSTGQCADYPHDPGWKPSTATATESVTQTQTQTAIGSYTTTVTLTLSHVTATSTLSDAGGGETASGSTSKTPLVSSIMSELSALSSLTLSSLHSGTLTTTHTLFSSSSPFLSVPTASSHPSSSTTSPHSSTIAGITLGSAGAIALLFLLCCICVRRRKKNAVEDKELKRELKEAAAVQVERNKALRALENRRTGVGSEGAWVSSPRFSTGWPGRRVG